MHFNIDALHCSSRHWQCEKPLDMTTLFSSSGESFQWLKDKWLPLCSQRLLSGNDGIESWAILCWNIIVAIIQNWLQDQTVIYLIPRNSPPFFRGQFFLASLSHLTICQPGTLLCTLITRQLSHVILPWQMSATALCISPLLLLFHIYCVIQWGSDCDNYVTIIFSHVRHM